MKWLLRLILTALTLLLIGLVWSLAGLPDAASYVSLQLPGWKLDTTLGSLLLASVALVVVLFGLRFLLRFLLRNLQRLRGRNTVKRRLKLAAAAFAGDWRQAGNLLPAMLAEEAADEAEAVTWKMLRAVQLLETGDAEQALELLASLEKTAVLKPAVGLLRVKALQRCGRSGEALELMQAVRSPPKSAHWLLLQMELLSKLGRWPELRKQLLGRQAASLAAERLAPLRYRTWLHLLQNARQPAEIVRCWDESKPWSDADQAEGLLETAVGCLLRLQKPGKAAALLLQELGGNRRDKALRLCHTLPPGVHCLPLLQRVRRMRGLASNYRLRAAYAWLLLCCANEQMGKETGDTVTPEQLLAGWSQD